MPLSRIADIRALSRAEAQKAPPVKVRGVVTLRDAFDPSPEWLVLDDGMESIWVQISIAKANRIWKGDDAGLKMLAVGDVLELEGACHPGGYAPVIVPSFIVKVGTSSLPPARKVDLARLLSGAEDCQRVELEGVIQGVNVPKPGADRVSLAVQAEGQTFQVIAERWPAIDPRRLIDARVRVRGVFSPISNFRAEMVALRIRIMGPDDVEVIDPPPEEPFDWPRVTLDRLRPFSPTGTSAHRCVTQGVVTFCAPGEFFFVQEGDVAVKVQAPGATVAVGDRVEISGFVDMSRLVGSMTGAVVRSLEHDTLPAPVRTTSSRLLNPQKVIEWERVVETDFDGRLVELRGRLRRVESNDAKKGAHLQIEMGKTNTTAHLVNASEAELAVVRSWAEGSDVELTGVCEMVFVSSAIPNMPKVTGFRLWLRSPQDVRILHAPPWWTPQRLTLALIVAVLAFVLVFGWSFALSRTLRRRTARLEDVMRHHRDAELEFQSAQQERQRLAADLHDGLQQMIAGVSYRLEAAMGEMERDPLEAQDQLAATRRALTATKTGLRECLWGLRQVEEGPGDFAALLRHAVDTNEHWPPGFVVLEAGGEPFALSRDVMGSLLLLVQEAISNALRHGRAQRVRVRLRYAVSELELEIEDDGAGFDPQSAPGTRDGHYGLEGMRQRMSWLGGTVKITSQAAHGTRVSIRLPREKACTTGPAAGTMETP